MQTVLNRMEFDVEETARGVELIPDFYVTDLPRDMRDEYRQMIDAMTFQNGAIQITGPDQEVFNPPERVDMDDINERMQDKFGITILTEDGYQQ